MGASNIMNYKMKIIPVFNVKLTLMSSTGNTSSTLVQVVSTAVMRYHTIIIYINIHIIPFMQENTIVTSLLEHGQIRDISFNETAGSDCTVWGHNSIFCRTGILSVTFSVITAQ